MLTATLAWATLTAGGAYVWAGAPIIAAGAVLLALQRPTILATESRGLDMALLAALAGAAMAALPLPSAIVSAVSPSREIVLGSLAVGPRAASGWQRLSLDGSATVYAVALAATALAVFWVSRHLCHVEGPRPVIRAVTAIGVVVGLAALIQPALDPARLYGLWVPLDQGARPFGPFVNRNHFATWALLAVPLAAGYVATSRSMSRPAATTAGAIVRTLGSRSTWVATTAGLLMLCLVTTGSRSGALGAAAAVATGLVLARKRLTPTARRWAPVSAVAVAGLLVVYGRIDLLLTRVEETLQRGAGDRMQIWRDTFRVIGDFWMTGTGAGTFPTSMLVYQESDRFLFTNQAHNHYLQLLAEGGASVAVPFIVAIVCFVTLVKNHLAREHTSHAWMRIGALAGLAGVSVQSCFDTGLRLPGNALLLAVTAAVAAHSPRRSDERYHGLLTRDGQASVQ